MYRGKEGAGQEKRDHIYEDVHVPKKYRTRPHSCFNGRRCSSLPNEWWRSNGWVRFRNATPIITTTTTIPPPPPPPPTPIQTPPLPPPRHPCRNHLQHRKPHHHTTTTGLGEVSTVTRLDSDKPGAPEQEHVRLTLPGTKQFSAQALQTMRRDSGPAFRFCRAVRSACGSKDSSRMTYAGCFTGLLPKNLTTSAAAAEDNGRRNG